MKKVLLRSATILYPESSFYNQAADVLFVDGLIAEVAPQIRNSESDVTILDAKDKYLSPGFFDLNANFGEPGFETREDLLSGSRAAAAGGFTGVALQPATNPPVHTRAEVSYIVNQTGPTLTDVYPVGCISQNRLGNDLAELYDMHSAGAIAFSDGLQPVKDSGLMSRAMLYAKGFDGLVFSYAEDEDLSRGGRMNEGVMSTYLGIKGSPSLAEAVQISRDIFLAEYNDCPLHFSTVSSAAGIKLIRDAKKKKLKVTCDVAAHHLVLTDKALESFDSNYKVKPPLRTEDDRKALIAAVKDGTIDAIVSQHTPYEIEFKAVEFHIASYGITGLQTVLPLALKAGLTPEKIVHVLAVQPRRILRLPVPELRVGQPANFVLFDAQKEWVLSEVSNQSKSKNTPFFNTSLLGSVVLVGNNNQILSF